MHTDPLTEYKRRLESRSADVRRYEEREHLVSVLRLVVAAVFIMTAWMVWGRDSLPASSLFVPVAGFFALVMYHERVYRKRKRAERAVRFYEHGIARIEDRWIGQGRSDFLFAPESHLYAADLDLFGKGSLFELLCTARTRAGEDTLARWLCGPADRNEIVKRQQAVEELRTNIDLREDLAILGDDVRSNIRPQL